MVALSLEDTRFRSGRGVREEDNDSTSDCLRGDESARLVCGRGDESARLVCCDSKG